MHPPSFISICDHIWSIGGIQILTIIYDSSCTCHVSPHHLHHQVKLGQMFTWSHIWVDIRWTSITFSTSQKYTYGMVGQCTIFHFSCPMRSFFRSSSCCGMMRFLFPHYSYYLVVSFFFSLPSRGMPGCHLINPCCWWYFAKNLHASQWNDHITIAPKGWQEANWVLPKGKGTMKRNFIDQIYYTS